MKRTNIKHYRMKNGRLVTIRPGRLQDTTLILEMHRRLSPNSIHNRYHRHYEPSRMAIENVCRIDDHAGAVFVATIDDPRETVIGMAYYLAEENPANAEPAIVVEDRFQGMGLGGFMAQHMGQHAIQQRIGVFTAYVLPGNEEIMHLIRRSGVSFHSTFSHGTREVHIELVPRAAAELAEAVVAFPETVEVEILEVAYSETA